MKPDRSIFFRGGEAVGAVGSGVVSGAVGGGMLAKLSV